MRENYINNYFFLIIAALPISIIVGPAVSLINILIFDLSFIILLIYKNNFKWIRNTYVRALLILYIYLIFNNLISLEQSSNFFRNFGFLRLIIFFVGLNYFLRFKEFNKIFPAWSVITLVLVFDIFIEKYTGQNLLGFGSDHNRVVSFFKDEPIPGSFVHSLAFMLVGFYLLKYKNSSTSYTFVLLLILIFCMYAVILTGERSNSIKFIIGFIIFIFLFEKVSYKKKIAICLISFSLLFILIQKNEYIKERMFSSINYSIKTFTYSFKHGKPQDNPSGNLYAKLYRSGYDVFKKYPYFGVGSKNYRIESCENNKYHLNIHIMINDYVCMTHPHQIYFEFLSEHGFFGTILILIIFIFFLFKIFKDVKFSKNYLALGSFVYLITVFMPILPSGAFFSDYNLTLFFLNLSIVFAKSKNLNIFKSSERDYI